MNITESDKKRFWEKVDVSGECWEWRAVTTSYGYGTFSLNGNKIGAHRFSYILENGNIPERMFICHHCDNPGCVNPKHLFLGTNSDNQKDAIAKGKWCLGEKHGMAILVENDVHEIRRLYSLGVKQVLLAKMWGISFQQISNIVLRKNWTHI